MKSRHLILPSVVVCAVALSVGISIIVRRAHAAAVPWVPYQISYKTYSKQPDWLEPVLLGESMEAVRSDGSSVESYVTYKLDRSIHSEQRVLTLPRGIRILSKERLGLMTATRDANEGNARARQRWDPLRSCAMTLEGGQINPTPLVTKEMFLGYETYKIVIDMKIFRKTLWRSPALGCAELRMLSEKLDQKSGHFFQASDRTAFEIRLGEADSSLFELPSGFRNVAPSELAIAARKACCNASLKETELAALQSLDEHFRQFRFDW